MSKNVLLHCCCAHCTAYTVEHWRKLGYDVTGFWYNPNIHPYLEYQNRLEAMKNLAFKLSLPLLIADSYDMVNYFRKVAGNEIKRCRYCFDLRLGQTARRAANEGFAFFSTTLLISPHQQHELVREVGDRSAVDNGVEFLYTDLRKRFSDSRHITRPMELYRQQYCGCVYSEFERYTEAPKTQPQAVIKKNKAST